MNPETLLNEVEKLILDRPQTEHERWHLCHTSDRLQLLPSNHTRIPHTVFMNLTPDKMHRGLTNAEWDHLLMDLAKFYEREI